MKTEDLERIGQAMEHLRQTGRYPYGSLPLCILCGSEKASGVELFCPYDSQKFGAPPDKDRVVIFVFCRRCIDLPDRQERAENKILADIRVQ